jgi:hypothetical protein
MPQFLGMLCLRLRKMRKPLPNIIKTGLIIHLDYGGIVMPLRTLLDEATYPLVQKRGHVRALHNPLPDNLANPLTDHLAGCGNHLAVFQFREPSSCCLFHRSSHNLHRALGHGLQKRLAILLRQHAVVQDHHDAGVRLGADQAADALAEFQDGLGQ